MPRLTRRRVGVLGFDAVEALDLLSPLETFAATRSVDGQKANMSYETLVVGVRCGPFTSESFRTSAMQ